jgi:chromosome segregation ATPase
MYGMKQTNAMLNERMQLLLKRINELTESNKVMSARITSLEKERDALSRLLSIERQKVVDMNRLVENTRSQLAAKEHELKRLREDLHVSGTSFLSDEKSRPLAESLAKRDMTLSPSASSYASLSSDMHDPNALMNSSFKDLAAAMRNTSKQDADILSNLGLSADDDSDTEDSL